jgi:DNA-binding transcriptional ArsR family regulator
MVKLEKLNKILKALGDPGRVRIIALLSKKRIFVYVRYKI